MKDPRKNYLDIGHLQILILSQDLTETDMWKDFFWNISEKNRWQEKIIYVFQTQEPEKPAGLEGRWNIGRRIYYRSYGKAEWTENRKMV